eukprot:3067101-Alexandrium_andersonii.AAC.1
MQTNASPEADTLHELPKPGPLGLKSRRSLPSQMAQAILGAPHHNSTLPALCSPSQHWRGDGNARPCRQGSVAA